MITASLVLYHNSQKDVDTITDCVLASSISRLYIVDNSKNDAFRILEQRSTKIRYIHSENVGYGAAHNIAIREAMTSGANYHVVINPDIVFQPRVIEALAEYMANHSDVGLIMPRVEYPNGDLQYLCKLLPTPADLLIRRFLPKGWMRSLQDRFELRAFGYDREMNIPYLSGCFMFLRLDALKQVGLFDERFFMYGEDIDLSRRIHNVYKTMYYPYVSIIHNHEKASYKNHKMLFVHICNVVRYFNKWGWIFDADRKKINDQTLKRLRLH